MDIVKEIKKQINSIKVEDNSIYLNRIYYHLDRAEKYYIQGNSDEHYFNDVIYRANQAYEGALTEAYKVLASKKDEKLSNTTLYKIEKHFKDNSIFRERVLQLFENYRQEWRNKSTHDHKLIFDENEAFIALTNVSSFVHLLLKQIQEKLAFINEQKRLTLEKGKLKIIQDKFASKGESLVERIVEVLTDFVYRNEFLISNDLVLEIEILGMLHGFLSMANEDLNISREPKIIFNNNFFRPDFIIDFEHQKTIIEVKRRFDKDRHEEIINQLVDCLEATEIMDGVLYYVSTVIGKPVVFIDNKTIERNGKDFNVYIVKT